MRCKKCGGLLRMLGGPLRGLTEYWECRHCKAKWMLGPVDEHDHELPVLR